MQRWDGQGVGAQWFGDTCMILDNDESLHWRHRHYLLPPCIWLYMYMKDRELRKLILKIGKLILYFWAKFLCVRSTESEYIPQTTEKQFSFTLMKIHYTWTDVVRLNTFAWGALITFLCIVNSGYNASAASLSGSEFSSVTCLRMIKMGKCMAHAIHTLGHIFRLADDWNNCSHIGEQVTATSAFGNDKSL